MNATPADEVILKTDVLGRVKTPATRREQLLDEFEKSGASGRAFAELIGVKYQTFATWAQKRRRQRGSYPTNKAKEVQQVRWLEAVVQETPPCGAPLPLVLELAGGAKLQIHDAKQAALAAVLLRALAKSC